MDTLNHQFVVCIVWRYIFWCELNDILAAKLSLIAAVVLFWPKYWSGHPENYVFLLYEKMYFWIKVSLKMWFNFENRSTGCMSNLLLRISQRGRNCSDCLIHSTVSDFVLTEISGMPTRKVLIFVIKMFIYRIRVSASVSK